MMGRSRLKFIVDTMYRGQGMENCAYPWVVHAGIISIFYIINLQIFSLLEYITILSNLEHINY